jgi:hypothetical protein
MRPRASAGPSESSLTMAQTTDPIDELLALPPAEFVSARNRLAGELKKTDGARAAEIKALPKPSPSIWALDRLAHEEPKQIAAFLQASQALEAAQSGTGGAEDGRRSYQSALATQREALDRLVTAARSLLEQAQLPTNRAVLERLTNNLRWAVLDDDSRRLLEDGRLTRDLEPPDFGALVGRIPVAGHAPPRRPPPLKLVPAAKETPARERAEHKRLESLRTKHAAAKEQVVAAREELRRTKATLDEAERALAAQRRELAAAEKKAADALRVHEAAEAALERRSSEVEALSEELRRPREE